MSLASQLTTLATRIATEIKAVRAQTARAMIGPSSHDALAWTTDPAFTSTGAITAGRIFVCRFKAAASGNATKIKVNVTSAGSGLTGAWFAIFSLDGNTRLCINASSAHTTFNSGTGEKVVTIPSTALVAGTEYVLMMLFVGTTAPTLTCGGGSNPNLGITVTADVPPRLMQSGTGQTTLPAAPVDWTSGLSLASTTLPCALITV